MNTMNTETEGLIDLGMVIDLNEFFAYHHAAEEASLVLQVYNPRSKTPFDKTVAENSLGLVLQRGNEEQLKKFWKKKRELYLSPAEMLAEQEKHTAAGKLDSIITNVRKSTAKER